MAATDCGDCEVSEAGIGYLPGPNCRQFYQVNNNVTSLFDFLHVCKVSPRCGCATIKPSKCPINAAGASLRYLYTEPDWFQCRGTPGGSFEQVLLCCPDGTSWNQEIKNCDYSGLEHCEVGFTGCPNSTAGRLRILVSISLHVYVNPQKVSTIDNCTKLFQYQNK